MAMLEVKDVEVRFGGIVALSGMTFDIEEGQICWNYWSKWCGEDDDV